jgi:hypothetical protein
MSFHNESDVVKILSTCEQENNKQKKKVCNTSDYHELLNETICH